MAEDASKKKAKIDHNGHRKRLDEKNRIVGAEQMPEHEVLERILFTVIPRGNTNFMAHELLKMCGSLYGVLTASPQELTKVAGIGNRAAEFLHDLLPLLGIVERCRMDEEGKSKPCLDTVEKMGEYAKSIFYGKLTEACYMVSLNASKRVYRLDRIAQGSLDEVPVYTREVIKLALYIEADSVFLVHNHPAGYLVPSQSDIAMTQEIGRGLMTLGIELIDHIIVGGGDYISLKQMGVF